MAGKRLYVGNLPYSVTEDQLKGLFAQAGTVETVTIISDKYSGRSKGFAFIEMANDEEAQKAIELLNGRDLDGRNLTVNEARPKEERSGGGERRGRFEGGGGGGGGFRRGRF